MRSLEQVARWPVRAAAVGVLVVGHDGAVQVAGTTGDTERPFAWASVTKLCTALAALVALEEGTVALSDLAGPPGSTVAHLLSHASGLAPDAMQELAAPGTRRIYSNAGFEVLGEHLRRASGIAVHDYVAEAVFVPLGMTGARLRNGASPAHGVVGGLRDLLALGAELLAPRLLAPETLGAATSVAFPGLAGLLPGFGHQDPNDWGLGFEIRGAKHPHWTGSSNHPATFGHFGRSGSFLWVDPGARTACAAICDGDFGPWAVAAWPALSDAVLQTVGALGPKIADRTPAS